MDKWSELNPNLNSHSHFHHLQLHTRIPGLLLDLHSPGNSQKVHQTPSEPPPHVEGY
ncbi:hypothetical protein M433DRAFT_421013 [Acidomyces richmondensis BFW]|nr:MAG: hypothetical protein FE78DRAFT_227235 [Acidomyces sp. 'richmondensis']KYG48392.1 hypothetical protein M433DRAFT_421013 [Acidomyces richmondensis BFW]